MSVKKRCTTSSEATFMGLFGQKLQILLALWSQFHCRFCKTATVPSSTLCDEIKTMWVPKRLTEQGTPPFYPIPHFIDNKCNKRVGRKDRKGKRSFQTLCTEFPIRAQKKGKCSSATMVRKAYVLSILQINCKIRGKLSHPSCFLMQTKPLHSVIHYQFNSILFQAENK